MKAIWHAKQNRKPEYESIEWPVEDLLPLPRNKKDESQEQRRWRRLGFPIRLRRVKT